MRTGTGWPPAMPGANSNCRAAASAAASKAAPADFATVTSVTRPGVVDVDGEDDVDAPAAGQLGRACVAGTKRNSFGGCSSVAGGGGGSAGVAGAGAAPPPGSPCAERGADRGKANERA